LKQSRLLLHQSWRLLLWLRAALEAVAFAICTRAGAFHSGFALLLKQSRLLFAPELAPSALGRVCCCTRAGAFHSGSVLPLRQSRLLFHQSWRLLLCYALLLKHSRLLLHLPLWFRAAFEAVLFDVAPELAPSILVPRCSLSIRVCYLAPELAPSALDPRCFRSSRVCFLHQS
jgi:hypothetical protein